MKTKILGKEGLAEAAELLLRGEVVAIPTETVYGLAASIRSEKALQTIFSLKQRPLDNPLIVHVSSLEMAASVGEIEVPHFKSLADQFWPGPLTLIVRKKEEISSVVSAGQPTIALRIPSHPMALELIEQVGAPLAAPSANLSGRPSPTSFLHVLEDFADQIPAIVDGGETLFGLESTVVSLVGPVPIRLRPGIVTLEQLEQAMGIPLALPTEATAPISPGMKYRHYAPRAKMRLVTSPHLVPSGSFVLSRMKIEKTNHRSLTPRSFYSALREADRLGVQEIWVVVDPLSEKNEALMNRLERSSGLIVNI